MTTELKMDAKGKDVSSRKGYGKQLDLLRAGSLVFISSLVVLPEALQVWVSSNLNTQLSDLAGDSDTYPPGLLMVRTLFTSTAVLILSPCISSIIFRFSYRVLRVLILSLYTSSITSSSSPHSFALYLRVHRPYILHPSSDPLSNRVLRVLIPSLYISSIHLPYLLFTSPDPVSGSVLMRELISMLMVILGFWSR
eukprot:1325468-Amorphochlora_amoeboformis.AAC.1